ncbi:1-aminocyclopropane-1-carboxylate deaminase/D-cysteine desulfhydrase [Tamlana sp. s12]|uniref:1-aminocyclopropane-1-carboxylate deaminase/D-cysteine desulfhydrase n=1 Tax=Tamlana sp. s12 TaxID=1630406 RepID=UPI0008013D27|nr:pyridoxal-phosphate dependent enzyme [Tamlana sp. s12]OBQ52194.1 1-aminocyclopropane-1-carboxylate deaminase [Tamlana sp. s12]QQY82299.1 1-aminocyclopropane-1-carboxylate deaminase/D-cysteine desulfhydrase [Tamlana sp. s12]
MIFKLENSVNQQVDLHHKDVELYVKREDAIHPFVSGNKYRKLKYNVLEAQKKGIKTLVTFGGAYSNHIAAVAAAGQLFGFKTVGIIRGEELWTEIDKNPTLSFAKQRGMRFKFVTREAYRRKSSSDFIAALKDEFGDYYHVPEGGTNTFAVKGCEEILTESDNEFDYICSAVGTGGTISGLINCSKPRQQVLGFPALKGDFLKSDISKFAKQSNWELITDYHFGGYAKINEELVAFINQFKTDYKIPLDPVYTGKMLFGIFDLIEKGFFPKGSKILAIHTGGLQGIEGMNALLKKKNLPLIML